VHEAVLLGRLVEELLVLRLLGCAVEGRVEDLLLDLRVDLDLLGHLGEELLALGAVLARLELAQ
jgi:hypothetical protein